MRQRQGNIKRQSIPQKIPHYYPFHIIMRFIPVSWMRKPKLRTPRHVFWNFVTRISWIGLLKITKKLAHWSTLILVSIKKNFKVVNQAKPSYLKHFIVLFTQNYFEQSFSELSLYVRMPDRIYICIEKLCSDWLIFSRLTFTRFHCPNQKMFGQKVLILQARGGAIRWNWSTGWSMQDCENLTVLSDENTRIVAPWVGLFNYTGQVTGP